MTDKLKNRLDELYRVRTKLTDNRIALECVEEEIKRNESLYFAHHNTYYHPNKWNGVSFENENKKS